eukprot:NODE_747_length_1222_cov_117.108676_g707_i0.p1 GENE.NODE_747_length_1222_cov_117.108676_g707_i0~~NODE_747_length_1222_cov_117.108676_g707_i0.p1  ORF type:complete len:371 (+),score=9.81 NODE_747_length_1222_cov_117.108676_g707_i0:87-1199(+)
MPVYQLLPDSPYPTLTCKDPATSSLWQLAVHSNTTHDVVALCGNHARIVPAIHFKLKNGAQHRPVKLHDWPPVHPHPTSSLRLRIGNLCTELLSEESAVEVQQRVGQSAATLCETDFIAVCTLQDWRWTEGSLVWERLRAPDNLLSDAYEQAAASESARSFVRVRKGEFDITPLNVTDSRHALDKKLAWDLSVALLKSRICGLQIVVASWQGAGSLVTEYSGSALRGVLEILESISAERKCVVALVGSFHAPSLNPMPHNWGCLSAKEEELPPAAVPSEGISSSQRASLSRTSGNTLESSPPTASHKGHCAGDRPLPARPGGQRDPSDHCYVYPVQWVKYGAVSTYEEPMDVVCHRPFFVELEVTNSVSQ